MNTYMVTLELAVRNERSEQLLNDARLNFFELMREGKLREMHVAVDHSKVWLLMKASGQTEVRALLKVLPIYANAKCHVAALEGE